MKEIEKLKKLNEMYTNNYNQMKEKVDLKNQSIDFKLQKLTDNLNLMTANFFKSSISKLNIEHTISKNDYIKKRYNETGEINKVDAMNAIIRFIDAYYPDGKKCNMDMILGKLYDAIYSPRNIIIYNHEYGTRFAEDSVSILIENAKTFDVVTRITFQYIESEFSIDCAVIDNRRLTNGKILINNYYFNDSDIVIHSFFRKPNDDEYFKGYIRTIAFDEDGNAYREGQKIRYGGRSD